MMPAFADRLPSLLMLLLQTMRVSVRSRAARQLEILASDTSSTSFNDRIFGNDTAPRVTGWRADRRSSHRTPLLREHSARRGHDLRPLLRLRINEDEVACVRQDCRLHGVAGAFGRSFV